MRYFGENLAAIAISAAVVSFTPGRLVGQQPNSAEAAMAAAEDKDRILSPKKMKEIADALGAKCTHCHIEKKPDGKPDYAAPSPLKETAKYMKIHFVDRLVTMDGQPVECGACHAGRPTFLPRELPPDAPKSAVPGDQKATMKRMGVIAKALGVQCDFCHAKGPDGQFVYQLPTRHKQIAKYMMTEFVGRYRLKGGGDLTCATCHAGKTEFLPRHSAEDEEPGHEGHAH